MRWRLDLSYDGTDFSGWAVQPGLRTVQGELQERLTAILRLPEAVALVCAGRTDAGVHARGQVAHADLPEELDIEPSALLRRLGRALPPDLVVRSVTPAPAAFDARFAAVWRRYVYRLWDGDSPPDPLHRWFVTRTRHRLDLDAMNAAATPLLGLRDFATFCRQREGATTVRTLLELAGGRVAHGPLAGLIEVTVRADAFCHSMVRSLLGGLVAVGSGRRDAAWLAEVAAARIRDPAVEVMPAHGLTLEEVGYPPADQLAARVAQARSVRDLR